MTLQPKAKKAKGVLARGNKYSNGEYINFFIGATLKDVEINTLGYCHRLGGDEPYDIYTPIEFKRNFPKRKVPLKGTKVVRTMEVITNV